MKKILITISALILLSCNDDNVTPNSPAQTPPTNNGLDGDWQELYSQYISYEGADHHINSISNPVYITLQGNSSSKIRLNNGLVYTVYDVNATNMGKYTDTYILLNSNPNDTLFWTSKTITKLVAESKAPANSNSYVTVRFTLDK
jgi:hypothetical protein